MGLFDKVLGNNNDKLNEAEGFTGIVFCAIASDGTIAQEEMNGLATTLSRMKLYNGLSNRDVTKMFDKIQRQFKDKGFEATMQLAANAVNPDLRATAFAVATDLLLSDGHVSQQEQKFLETIQNHLDIPDDLAMKIVEVIEIKNRG